MIWLGSQATDWHGWHATAAPPLELPGKMDAADETNFTPSSRHLHLPPELWDRVIDHLHGDRKALRCTALVCKAWTPSSHFHLFSVMRIDRTTSFEIRSLSETPHLAAQVRTLELAGSILKSMSDLLPVLDAMPRLNRLCLSEHLHFGAQGIPDSTRPRSTPIPELAIWNCHLPVKSLRKLLSFFTSIGHLRLILVYSNWDHNGLLEPQISHTLSTHPIIYKLSASMTKVDFVRRVVQETPSVENLHTLVLNSCFDLWSQRVDSTRELLLRIRSTVRHLEFMIKPTLEDEKRLTEGSAESAFFPCVFDTLTSYPADDHASVV